MGYRQKQEEEEGVGAVQLYISNLQIITLIMLECSLLPGDGGLDFQAWKLDHVSVICDKFQAQSCKNWMTNGKKYLKKGKIEKCSWEKG